MSIPLTIIVRESSAPLKVSPLSLNTRLFFPRLGGVLAVTGDDARPTLQLRPAAGMIGESVITLTAVGIAPISFLYTVTEGEVPVSIQRQPTGLVAATGSDHTLEVLAEGTATLF